MASYRRYGNRSLAGYDLLVGLIRLIVFLVTKHQGRIFLGASLLIGGIIYGVTSHTIVYSQAPQGHYHVYNMDSGAYYIRQEGTSTYYIINNMSNFTPYFDPNTFDQDKYFTALTYQSDAPQNISFDTRDENDIPIGHESGTGYPIVHIALGDRPSHTLASYGTAEYNQHPSGFYENRWLGGSPYIGAGLLVLLFTFVLRAITGRIAARKIAADAIEQNV